MSMSIKSQYVYDKIKDKLKVVTPTEYQFQKFNQLPISEYSGNPSIDIPLWNIQIRDYSLPLVLKYHSKGIKVAEEADWVGLGWDLSFGSITQIVYDKNDLDDYFEHKDTIPYTNASFPAFWPFSASNGPALSEMVINNSTQDYSDDKTFSFITFNKNLGSGLGQTNNWNIDAMIPAFTPHEIQSVYDFERDLFSVNLPEDHFIIRMKFKKKVSNSSVGDTTYMVLNKKGYKVNLNKTTLIWRIVDPNGIIYLFEKNNKNWSSIGDNFTYGIDEYFSDDKTLLSSNGNTAPANNNVSDENNFAGTNKRYSWQITKIINTYGDTIKFNYSQKRYIQSISNTYQRSLRLIAGNSSDEYEVGSIPEHAVFMPLYNYPIVDEHNIPSYFMENPARRVQKLSTVPSENRYYVESIEYNKNKINFYTSYRQDCENALKLDSICVYNGLNDKINSLKFNYDYFTAEKQGRGWVSNSIANLKRLKLVSLNILNNDKYFFTYNNVQLPPKTSFAVDYWGYYNGQINNKTPFPNPMDFTELKLNYQEINSITPDFLNTYCGVMFSDDYYCKAGMLEKIQYPTGGYAKLYYGLNEFKNYSIKNNPKYVNNIGITKGNGLRIDSIVHFMNDGNASNRISYTYNGGKLLNHTDFFFINKEGCSFIRTLDMKYLYEYSSYFLNILTNNALTSSPLNDNYGIGYDSVSIYVPKNGKTIRTFTNNIDIVADLSNRYTPNGFVNPLPSYQKGFPNGLPLYEYVYDKNNVLQQKTKNTYKLIVPNYIFYNSKVIYSGYMDFSPVSNYNIIEVNYFPIYKTYALLEKRETYNYFNGNEIINWESFLYNKNDAISIKNSAMSNGSQSKSEEFKYPEDIYDDSSFSQEQRNIMQSLKNKNRLNEIVQKNTAVYTKGQGSIIKSYVEFDPNLLLPNKVSKAIGYNTPFMTEFILNYDNNKNIKEITDKSNLTTTYLWGYNNQYPIAEIKNASYSQVSSALSKDPLKISAETSPDMSIVDGLRNKLTNSMINTYVYKPLVGLTSATDQRGVTARYIYDAANRLALNRDYNNNVLAKYRYNFSNAPSSSSDTPSPLSAVINKNDNTYFKYENTATVQVNGGSGNIGYSWYLKNASGTVLASSVNSGLAKFVFTPTQIGALTLECVVTDYYTNQTMSCSKSINCVYAPLIATINTDNESYPKARIIVETPPIYNSNCNATIVITGGSLSYTVVRWEVKNNENTIIYNSATPYYLTNYSFPCTVSGTLKISCYISDNVTHESKIINKNITVY